MKDFNTLKEFKNHIVKVTIPTFGFGLYGGFGDYEFELGINSNWENTTGCHTLLFLTKEGMQRFKDDVVKLQDVLKVVWDAERADVYYGNGQRALILKLY